jgi:hypothetical protein
LELSSARDVVQLGMASARRLTGSGERGHYENKLRAGPDQATATGTASNHRLSAALHLARRLPQLWPAAIQPPCALQPIAMGCGDVE